MTAEDTLAYFVPQRDGPDVPPEVRDVAAEACLDCVGVGEPDRVHGLWARLLELSSIREAMAVASHASAGR